jgi:hypothetical protein
MELIELLGQADRQLGRLEMHPEYIPDIDLFVRMHVLKEATQSSRIEGNRTSLDEALRRRADVAAEKRGAWEEAIPLMRPTGARNRAWRQPQACNAPRSRRQMRLTWVGLDRAPTGRIGDGMRQSEHGRGSPQRRGTRWAPLVPHQPHVQTRFPPRRVPRPSILPSRFSPLDRASLAIALVRLNMNLAAHSPV